MYKVVLVLLSCVSLGFAQSISPIFEAVTRNDIATVDALMRNRAAVNITNLDGMTPLHFASSAEMANILLLNGANPNIPNKRGATALHWAASQSNENLLRVLFKYEADPNIADNNGNTPLHYAAERGDNISILLLLHGGANPNAANLIGNTPLLVSLTAKKLDSAYYLIMGGAQDIINKLGERPARMVSPITSPDLLTALINPPAPALIRAIFLEQYPQAIELIKAGTREQLSEQDVFGNTALHWALQKRNKEISQMLLKKGVNLGATNNNGQAPMDLLYLIPDTNFVNSVRNY